MDAENLSRGIQVSEGCRESQRDAENLSEGYRGGLREAEDESFFFYSLHLARGCSTTTTAAQLVS